MDLHAQQQSISIVDSETGEVMEKTLQHEGEQGHKIDKKNTAL